MTTETKWTADFANRLRQSGAMVLNVHGHAMQEAGWPDLQVYSPVFTGHFEIKRNNARVRPNQKDVMNRLEQRGTRVCVLRFRDETSDTELDVETQNGAHLGTVAVKELKPFDLLSAIGRLVL